MNEYYETHKQTHVIPILVTLTDEEWYDAQSFFPKDVLFFECTRHTLKDESMMAEDSNFGDFIRWLFKLAPTDKNIPVDIIARRVCEFVRTIDKSEINPLDVKDEFVATVNSICEYLGYGKIGRSLVFDMYYGSWEKINPDTIELEHGHDYWRVTLKNDMLYCSDRWSWGGLLRCVWEYNMWEKSFIHKKI